MEHSRLLAALTAESGALLDAARSAAPDAAVPGCPDWQVGDLVWHVATVHDFWAWATRERASTPDGYEPPARPEPGPDAHEALVAVASERAASLRRVLEAADAASPVWTWTDDHTAGWVTRRMAHETAVHRIDADRAAGGTARLDPTLAADGVDEYLTHFLDHRLAGGPPLGGTVHLHCTDADGEWTIVPGNDGGHAVTREHAKGDAAMRGDAHDLLMVMWGRAGLDAVTIFGDADLAARLAGARAPADP